MTDRTDLVKGLSAKAFESGGVPHDHVYRPLGKEELMQAVVGDLGNGDGTGRGLRGTACSPVFVLVGSIKALTPIPPFRKKTRDAKKTHTNCGHCINTASPMYPAI